MSGEIITLYYDGNAQSVKGSKLEGINQNKISSSYMMLNVPVTTLSVFLLPHVLFQKITMLFLLVKQMILKCSLC